MHFEVVVDFGDRAIHDKPKRCNTPAELATYLARVPDTFGFYHEGTARISVTTVYEGDHPQLPFPKPERHIPHA